MSDDPTWGLRRWLRQITDAGVDPEMPRTEARHIRVLNAVSVVLTVQSIAYVPLFAYYLPYTWPIFVLNLPMILGWRAIPEINRRRRYDLARYVALSTALLQVGGVAGFSGRESLIHYYFVGGIAFAFTIFPRSRPGGLMIYAGLCTLAFWFIQIAAPSGWTYVPASFIQWLQGSMLVGLVAFISMVSFHSRREMMRADDAAARAHAQSERLLLNILPPSISVRLKSGEETIADAVPIATVLFADIVGFTKLSQTVSPPELVQMLDDIFSHFDKIIAQHGLEKIKTIGDAYMAAAGVPLGLGDHAERAARAALAIQAAMEGEVGQRHPGLRIRIGLHSGPLVAGVIGRSKFAYDVWGDTVNTASRMESHSVPGQIGVGRALRDRLQSRFHFEERGAVEVKGKGSMELYFLVSEKPSEDLASAAN